MSNIVNKEVTCNTNTMPLNIKVNNECDIHDNTFMDMSNDGESVVRGVARRYEQPQPRKRTLVYNVPHDMREHECDEFNVWPDDLVKSSFSKVAPAPIEHKVTRARWQEYEGQQTLYEVDEEVRCSTPINEHQTSQPQVLPSLQEQQQDTLSTPVEQEVLSQIDTQEESSVLARRDSLFDSSMTLLQITEDQMLTQPPLSEQQSIEYLLEKCLRRIVCKAHLTHQSLQYEAAAIANAGIQPTIECESRVIAQFINNDPRAFCYNARALEKFRMVSRWLREEKIQSAIERRQEELSILIEVLQQRKHGFGDDIDVPLELERQRRQQERLEYNVQRGNSDEVNRILQQHDSNTTQTLHYTLAQIYADEIAKDRAKERWV